MLDYANNEIIIDGCYGCAYAKHEFTLPCGLIYEDNILTISQDWELPINGFIVICPKRHVEFLHELTVEELNHLFEYTQKTEKFLKELNICEEFGIVISEKRGVHLHVWLSPKNKLANEKFKGGIAFIKDYFKYAKENLKTEENFSLIKNTTKKLRKKFNV